jgi:hypothetical protein
MKSGAMSRPGAGQPIGIVMAVETGCPLLLFRRAAVRCNREMPLFRSTATEGAEQKDLHRE